MSYMLLLVRSRWEYFRWGGHSDSRDYFTGSRFANNLVHFTGREKKEAHFQVYILKVYLYTTI